MGGIVVQETHPYPDEAAALADGMTQAEIDAYRANIAIRQSATSTGDHFSTPRDRAEEEEHLKLALAESSVGLTGTAASSPQQCMQCVKSCQLAVVVCACMPASGCS